mmetsp:Transcript_129681/g.211186  ORF Transcript_129681/g.211186 Transcript_129681/m.211186 type:complete len:93 (-) Transcript_129681:1146-1424(-)
MLHGAPCPKDVYSKVRAENNQRQAPELQDDDYFSFSSLAKAHSTSLTICLFFIGTCGTVPGFECFLRFSSLRALASRMMRRFSVSVLIILGT